MNKNYWLLMAAALLLTSCEKCPPCEREAVAAAPTEEAAAKVITPGTYRVCRDDGESGHGTVVGAHLVVGEIVEIKPFGAHGATKVCLKKACPPGGPQPPESEVKVLWMAGDKHKLGTDTTFDHKTENGQIEKVPHFVQIFNDPADTDDDEDCKLPNQLTINFCERSENGEELNCVGGTGTHLGHVHVEN